jgi:hypothetical protein
MIFAADLDAAEGEQIHIKESRRHLQVLVNWAKSKPEFAEAAYDSAVSSFSADGSIPEDGMRVVLDGLRKSMNLGRQISLSEVADLAPLFEAQRELGLRK